MLTKTFAGEAPELERAIEIAEKKHLEWVQEFLGGVREHQVAYTIEEVRAASGSALLDQGVAHGMGFTIYYWHAITIYYAPNYDVLRDMREAP